jgi:hypothetical protein
MTTITKECVLVASIFDNPTGKFGASLCTALAHWEWWESVECKILAQAIVTCMDKQKIPSRSFVRPQLREDYRDWPFHPMFGATNALSLELADHEAASLLPIYRNKRIVGAINKAYSDTLEHPEKARAIAASLSQTLTGLL